MRNELESQEVCEAYNLDPAVRKSLPPNYPANTFTQVVQKYIRFGEVFSTLST